jgi:DNA invertase Pin-like site-specific DNA recombinase
MPRRAAPRLRGAPGQPRFVSYYRVSTAQQGASGLGLEAQREAVSRHVAGAAGVIVAEFTEVESGKRNDRPQIAAALAACRLRRATLVIAKLDRLARNVAFISNLMESGVDFVACDNPHATRLTIHILAAVAEHEREMISQRTIAALAAAKARGIRLGNPRLHPGSRSAARVARRARTEHANSHAADVMPYITAAKRAGCASLGELAQALTARGISTPSGKNTDWTRGQVARVIARAQQPRWTAEDIARADAEAEGLCQHFRPAAD